MSKQQILDHLSENPEHILCELVKDDCELAKIIWGIAEKDYEVNEKMIINNPNGDNANYLLVEGFTVYIAMPAFKLHLQQLILEPDRLKYLRLFLEGEE